MVHLVLRACGEAVFGDVGVAMIAVLKCNAYYEEIKYGKAGEKRILSLIAFLLF